MTQTHLDWQIDRERSSGNLLFLVCSKGEIEARISHTGRTVIFSTEKHRRVITANKVVYPAAVEALASQWFGPRWRRG